MKKGEFIYAYNIPSSGYQDGDAFIIGNGSMWGRSNAFRVQSNGNVYSAGAINPSGADYAEMDAFNKIADYYKAKAAAEKDKTLDDAARMLDEDMANGFVTAVSAAKANADRGALRSLVWSEKVSMMMSSLLKRFAVEGGAMPDFLNPVPGVDPYFFTRIIRIGEIIYSIRIRYAGF